MKQNLKVAIEKGTADFLPTRVKVHKTATDGKKVVKSGTKKEKYRLQY